MAAWLCCWGCAGTRGEQTQGGKVTEMELDRACRERREWWSTHVVRGAWYLLRHTLWIGWLSCPKLRGSAMGGAVLADRCCRAGQFKLCRERYGLACNTLHWRAVCPARILGVIQWA